MSTLNYYVSQGFLNDASVTLIDNTVLQFWYYVLYSFVLDTNFFPIDFKNFLIALLTTLL